MEDLIEALQIFSRYMNDNEKRCPLICEHDVLIIAFENADVVTGKADIKRLEELSFERSDEYAGQYVSYRFGSA